MPFSGGDPLQVTQEGGCFGLESRDGEYLYYAKSFLKTSIWRVSIEGGEETEILAGPVGWRDWDLASEGIYYSESRREVEPGVNDFRVYYLDLKTGKTMEVFREEGPSGHMWLAVSPDETAVLFSKWQPWESDLVLVENFH